MLTEELMGIKRNEKGVILMDILYWLLGGVIILAQFIWWIGSFL